MLTEWITIGLGIGMPVVSAFAALWALSLKKDAKLLRAEMALIRSALEGKLKLVQSKQATYGKNQEAIWRKLQRHSDKFGELEVVAAKLIERGKHKSHPDIDQVIDE